MKERVYANASLRFEASPERVFDAWLDPQKARVWMAAALREMGLPGDIRRVQIDTRVGGSFTFSDMRDGVEARHWGTYLEMDRPRRLVFTWIVDESEEADPSKVTLTIEPDGAGCIATVVHELDAAWVEYVARTEEGWTRMLHAINATAL